MRVHWTTTAQKHLLDIFEYIAADSELYAQRMVDRLTLRSQQISGFPMSGRMVPEYELPEIREVIRACRLPRHPWSQVSGCLSPIARTAADETGQRALPLPGDGSSHAVTQECSVET